ncbi:MAG: hypothetical protein KatS3mg050_3166 [Litorilinea sp.]|nr:MAG: hypothetical protein KatS3mg050_3166 [Litorilinea sp.]
MDYGKALTFITEDERWQEKIAIGTGIILLSSILSIVLIGVLGFFIVMGYGVRLMQNVRDGAPHPLPEWDQWGDDLMRGFKLFVVALVWSLPLVLFWIPVVIGGAMADSRGAAEFIGTTLALCGSCLMVLYGLFLAVMAPGFSIAFATDEEIRSGLQFREIWEWTVEHIGQIIVVALVYLVASILISLVAGIVGTLLCLVGLVVTVPLGTLVTYLFEYHLFGQLAHAYPFPAAAASYTSYAPYGSPTAQEESPAPAEDEGAGDEPPTPPTVPNA